MGADLIACLTRRAEDVCRHQDPALFAGRAYILFGFFGTRVLQSLCWVDMFHLWRYLVTEKEKWYKVIVNLVMIFIGMQFIELAYATEYFQSKSLSNNIHVLYAMYLAFVAGLFPNYATIFASELISMNRKNLREILEVLVFFLLTFLLNIAVIFLSLFV